MYRSVDGQKGGKFFSSKNSGKPELKGGVYTKGSEGEAMQAAKSPTTLGSIVLTGVSSGA